MRETECRQEIMNVGGEWKLDGVEDRLLSGVKVLEITTGPSGSYAGRLFQRSGAEVMKVSYKPETFSKFSDCGKNIQYTENENEVAGAVSILLESGWDVIIWDSHCDTALDGLLRNSFEYNMNLRACMGVFIEFPVEIDDEEEDALQAIGGWMELTGDPKKSPLAIGGYPASCLVGAHAAAAGIIALNLNRDNKKNSRFIRIDALSIVVSALEGAFSAYLATGSARGRVGNRHHAMSPMAILPCQDGWAFVGAPVDEKWQLLEAWAELPLIPEWENADGRFESCGILEESLSKWTCKMKRNDLFATGQAFRMPFAKVQTLEEVHNCPQLQARGFWSGASSEKAGINLPWKIQLNHVPNNQKNNIKNNSKHLRILDLTSMWSGPYCTRLFADSGIEVIKIEAPHRPDGIRSGQGASAPFFRELNRNKWGVQLDLTKRADRRIFLELVKNSDVVVENFSPRVMANFGLDHKELWRHHPELIILSLSAFGQTGPYRDYVGYGPTLEAMSGLASVTHYGDHKPFLPGFSISDMGAGIHAAFALAASLYYRRRNQAGIRVDASQYEAACQFVGDYLLGGMQSGKRKSPTKIRNLIDLANDQRISRISIPGGDSLLGMPWGSKGGNVFLKPPPMFGQHTSQLHRFMDRGGISPAYK
ncbi:MAG: CoA transferase [Bacillus sp. (in: firmicutes)]